MHTERFDDLTRLLAAGLSRRRIMQVVGGGIAGATFGLLRRRSQAYERELRCLVANEGADCPAGEFCCPSAAQPAQGVCCPVESSCTAGICGFVCPAPGSCDVSACGTVPPGIPAGSCACVATAESGTMCVAASCVSPGTPCVTNFDCPRGLVCSTTAGQCCGRSTPICVTPCIPVPVMVTPGIAPAAAGWRRR